MITSRACDLCTGALQADVVRLTMRSGEVAFLVQQRWRIQARPAGLQVMTICVHCSEYLVAAVRHLVEQRGAAGPDATASHQHDGDVAAAS